MCNDFSFQRGDACLHFLETLRNQTVLECIMKRYQGMGVSVDVESLVNTVHTNDVIVILLLLYFYHAHIQSSECSPLSIACKHGAVTSAHLLLTYGANPNGCDNVSRICMNLCLELTRIMLHRESIVL